LTGPSLRALNQAARELLLSQASDWAFMINSGNMGDYPSRRIKSHLEHFHQLKEQVEKAAVDEDWVERLENENKIFPGIETFAAFRTNGIAPRTVIQPVVSEDEPEHRDRIVETPFRAQLHIVMVCPEILPFAKTGGLADMAGALALALEELGHCVSIVMPAYRQVFRAGIPLYDSGIHVTATVDGRMQDAEVLTTTIGRAIKSYFVRADRYFDRGHLYRTSEADYSDNAERFAFFNRAALELLGKIDPADILHAHDWQTALAIAFLKSQPERYPGLAGIGTVLTVHNLGYQGLFSSNNWRFLDLDQNFFSPKWLEFYGKINFLKAGLVFTDTITTVSRTYAREIATSEYRFGLEGVFQPRAKDVIGIMNGANYDVWNPSADPFLARNFSPDDLAGKRACKADLQEIFGLPQMGCVPLLAVGSRLDAPERVDLLESMLDQLLQSDVQLVLLGGGDKHYQDYFQAAALRYPGRLGVRISFDEALAHKIEAGADIFLMPSRYEPSGLNQLYSMKYGTIPVVRATGGLRDSVDEFDSDRGSGTGFLFDSYDSNDFLAAIDRALALYRRKDEWAKIMKNAMAVAYSWSRSASEYAALYKRLRFSYRD